MLPLRLWRTISRDLVENGHHRSSCMRYSKYRCVWYWSVQKNRRIPEKEARNSWSPGEIIDFKIAKIYKERAHCCQVYIQISCQISIGVNKKLMVAEVMWAPITWRQRYSTTWRKRPPSKINSAFHVMMNVFHDLCKYLKKGNLPHYFLPECNLLATVGRDETQIALQTMQDIVCDPIATILKCPSEPSEILRWCPRRWPCGCLPRCFGLIHAVSGDRKTLHSSSRGWISGDCGATGDSWLLIGMMGLPTG